MRHATAHSDLHEPDYPIEPDPRDVAERAAQVMAYWQRDDSRHYGKFSDAMNDAVCDDSLKSNLFDLWLKGDTAQLGIVLAKRMTADLAAMADQYARDELLGVLGKTDERIPK